MKFPHILAFLAFASFAYAAKVEITVFAALDPEKIAAAGMKAEYKRDMPDFTVTYLRGPGPGDVIGIYEGDFPSMFSSSGKRLDEVKGAIAEQPVVWVCWSERKEGKQLFGAETVMRSRRVVIAEAKADFVQQLHVFIFRQDLKSLAAARELIASLIRKPANQALVPTPMSVTPVAGAPVAPATGAAHL